MKCPMCDGEGGWIEMIDPEIGGPHYHCEMCNQTGRVSIFLWLSWHYYRIRDERRLRKALATKEEK